MVIWCIKCDKPCRGPLDFVLHITIPKYAHHGFEIRLEAGREHEIASH